MKWTVLNALGGLTWLAGLSFAKGAALPDISAVGDHRIFVGFAVGVSGLVLLFWANIRSAA